MDAYDSGVDDANKAGVGAALVAAAKESKVDLVASLLEQGADVNSSKDEEGCTPLVAGCEHGSTELVKLLVEHGADVIMKAEQTNEEVPGFITPLCMALGQGHEEVAALLIEHGADVNAVGLVVPVGEGTVSTTPLIAAAQKELQHTTKLLLERGAEVDKETEMLFDGEFVSLTALMVVTNAEVAKLLLEYGAQVDFKASHGGLTALMGASKQGRYEVAELLLERGAQVDLQDSDGWTALMYAVVRNKANLVQLLIDRKASIDIKTDLSETAIDLAREEDLTAIVELLNNTATAEIVETQTEVVENESIACKTTPPEAHDFMSALTSMFHEKIDTLSNRMDNIDSRLCRVESNGAASNNPPRQQEDSVPPELAEAHRILKPIASEWENIGMYLQVPDREIKAIKMQEHGVVRNCLRELLIVWLRGVAPPPSWRALAEAVREVDERVAREIQDRHTH